MDDYTCKKLWLVSFDMWEKWCRELQKNYQANKVLDLEKNDSSTRSLLRISVVELKPYKWRRFYTAPADFQTPKFCKKMKIKA